MTTIAGVALARTASLTQRPELMFPDPAPAAPAPPTNSARANGYWVGASFGNLARASVLSAIAGGGIGYTLASAMGKSARSWGVNGAVAGLSLLGVIGLLSRPPD